MENVRAQEQRIAEKRVNPTADPTTSAQRCSTNQIKVVSIYYMTNHTNRRKNRETEIVLRTKTE